MGSESLISAFPERHRLSMPAPKVKINDSDPIDPLVYGQRNPDEFYYHDEFTALAEKHPNFTYVPALSDEPEGSDWDGFRGYVHDAAKAHFDNDFRDHEAYLCGPPLMIDPASPP